MPCIKCGSKLADGQIFCASCLEDMNAYPVKPGTPIQLPPQQPVLAVKSRRKKHRERKPEEEIRRLRSAVRLLILILVVSLIAFSLACVLLLTLLEQRNLYLPL